jgi:hypothetical protein
MNDRTEISTKNTGRLEISTKLFSPKPNHKKKKEKQMIQEERECLLCALVVK